MFGDSLVESRVDSLYSSKRWTVLASIGLQATIAGVVITLPLLHPEVPVLRLDAPKVWMPLMPKQPPPPVQVHREASASSSDFCAACHQDRCASQRSRHQLVHLDQLHGLVLSSDD